MAFIQAVIAFLSSPAGALLFAALFALSEFLASFPGIAANSIFQAIKNGIIALKNKFPVK